MDHLDLLQHWLADNGGLRIASDIAPILEVEFGSRFATTVHGGLKKRQGAGRDSGRRRKGVRWRRVWCTVAEE